MKTCNYVKPWIGKCSNQCEGVYCDEHKNKKCCICGKQATHGCDKRNESI